MLMVVQMMMMTSICLVVSGVSRFFWGVIRVKKILKMCRMRFTFFFVTRPTPKKKVTRFMLLGRKKKLVTFFWLRVLCFF